MSDDPDSPPEREMKDFQFRQMKKTRVFDSPEDLPKERSSLLALSNKFGLIFVGMDRTLKVYLTQDILAVDKVEGNANKIVEGKTALVEVSVDLQLHHLALSCDELTLSVCGMSEEAGLSLAFYDVRTLMNKMKPQKLPFTSLQPAVEPGTCVQDLKWNPVQASMLAACLSDGSMMVLDVTDNVTVQAELPTISGITCICWSPKGKQVAVGKMNATVSQYTPTLQEKKVIPCPNFYTSDNPVKVLDVLWLRTYVFAVVYAAADGSPETPPDLVVISLPKKDDKTESRYLNFNDLVYGTCAERQHHYFLSHIEDWDVVFAASAASTEVSVIARQEDKNLWELWMLEDASRAELPVSQTSEDTLPLGLAIDYTSQHEIRISDEKTLPPAPIMLLLSTDGVLCPFSLLNLNPGAKQLVSAPSTLALDGERLPTAGSSVPPPLKPAASIHPAPVAFPGLLPTSAASSTPPPPAASSAAAPFTISSTAPVSSSFSSSGFSFSLPSSSSTSAAAPSAFSQGGSTIFGSGPSSGFSFASKPPSDTHSAPSAFSFSAPSIKPPAEAAPAPAPAPGPGPAPTPAPTPQCFPAASPISVLRDTPESATPAVKLNLNERFSSVETPAPATQSFSFNSSAPKSVVSDSSSLSGPQPSAPKPAPVRPVQTNTPPAVIQKPPPASQCRASTPQAALSVKALEKQLQQKKDSDPIMAGLLEEIAHLQKELDDLKARSVKADFKVGTSEEMQQLKNESEDFRAFTLEIKDTTESLHGDIGTLRTILLEGFAGAGEAKAQSELSKDRLYLKLLHKKPLDPRREEQLKEIRRLYQYVTFAVEDVNGVLDVEWEKHLEKKRQKHMVVPGRQALFTTLANNLYIINQQKSRLDQLIRELTSLRLYNRTSAWSTAPPATNTHTAAASPAGLDSELESLRDALLKARLEVTPPKVKSLVKISPVKQSQLRNFLSKGQMPPVRATAPANLSRSAFLSPKYYEDLDDVSSTSSLSQSLEPHPVHLELEEEEELEPEPLPLPITSSTLANTRHPTVVRTPSIQPGLGALQSTPIAKIHSGLVIGSGLSPIPSAVPTNKINLGGADSTALATKTVKHGAPPTERAVPVTISAQQAAATAALRRQMASQKPAAVSTSLTESTLKTVPQVVNVQELKDKGPPMPVSTVISSSVPPPAAQVIQQVLATVASNQAKRNTTQGIMKVSAESTTTPQTGFIFGGPPKADAPVIPTNSAEQSSSKGFSFTPASTNFSFTSVSQGAGISQAKDVSKFSFSGSGKMVFGQTGEEPFSLTPKSTSPALGTGSPTPPPNMSGEPVRPSSTTPALRVEPQPPKAIGGETLGSFSGLRVGQGEEAKDPSAKPTAASFSFGDNGVGLGKGAAQFTFGTALQKPTEDSTGTDLSKGAATVSSGSVFKPPESNSKLAFSIPQSSSTASALPTFSSLLAAPLDSPEEPKAPIHPSDPTPPPEPEPAPEPTVERVSPPVTAEPGLATDSSTTEPAATTVKVPTPPAVAPSPAPTPVPPAFINPPAEATPPTPAAAAPTVETTPDTTPAPAAPPATATPSLEAPSQPAPPAFQAPSSDKPGSIFTQPAPATTDSSSIGVTPVINTAAPTATTQTSTVASTAATSASTVFGQSAVVPASSAPAATGFGSSGFGTATGTGFSKPIFGQVSGFGQPSSNTGTSSGFSFGQPAFGASSSSSTTGGSGSLFGASTASNASSFSFGTSSANTASSSGIGLFGQSATPAFGQQSSGFGQGSVFGSNTITTSSTGFSFGQPSAFGSSSTTSVFGQQPSGGSVFGQQQPSGGGLFGSSSANTSGSSAGGVFFSGLGGKPSEEAANKNPFGATASTGAFGQSNQTGANLFGNSGAKAFGFGQSSFGEQKPSGTFSTGGGSVASQGFGSFSSPTKPSGFGSAPVFGSPPSFGGSPAFGSAAAFGSGPSFSGPMASPASKVFGEGTAAANVGGFGFASPQSAPSFGSLAGQSAPSFGGLAQQSPGFVAQPSSFSGFGQPPQGGAFSGSSFGSTNQSSSQTFASWRS